MFTGLIEEIGTVAAILATGHGRQLLLAAPRIASEARIGDSVAVNGCCLTVTAHSAEELTFDLLEETIARTNLGALEPGSIANLERALAMNGRLDGHFVQGHVDCTALITAFKQQGADFRLEIAVPEDLLRYIAEKGSIAVDGISLTVAEVKRLSFVSWIIPHTRQHTNLVQARAGDSVNLEFDVLAKYVERLLPHALSQDRPRFADN
jgi:riboflavin synthase